MSDKEMITAETLARSLSDSIARMMDEAIYAALAEAALIADHVEATARPGDGKDTAAEIARRIRVIMEAHDG